MKLRDYQEFALSECGKSFRKNKRVILNAPTSFGKCQHPDTKIILSDGSIKTAKEIRVGDRLLGPDSNPRTVESLCSGKEKMYKITPIRGGEEVIVNESHILVLFISGAAEVTDRYGHGRSGIIYMTVKDYMMCSKSFKHVAKLIRSCALEFPDSEKKDLPIHPYILGFWLGDGCLGYPLLHKPKVGFACEEICKQEGYDYRIFPACKDNCEKMRISISKQLRELGLLKIEKKIPKQYLTSSIENRKLILSGLLDSDGNIVKGGWEFNNTNEGLVKSVVFIARSLGYFCSNSKSRITKGFGEYCLSYRCNIFPDEKLPTRLKFPSKRIMKKNPRVSGFSIEDLGIGDYCGFSIKEDDKEYLWGDFTRTHNSITSVIAAKRSAEKGNRVCILVHRQEIFAQFFKTFLSVGITPSLISSGSKIQYGQQIYLGMVDTFRSRMKQGDIITRLDIDLLICDEVHYGSYEAIVNRFPKYVLGLSATPKSASGLELNQYFDDCLCPVKGSDLIQQGYLVKGLTYSIEYDFSSLKLSGRDFNKKQLEEEFQKPQLFTGTLEQYERHAKGLKAICYSTSIERSIEAASLFQEAGYKSFHVDATSEHRKEIFRAFKESESAVLFNVEIATTGYDEPSVECIIQNFATAQVTKHHQTLGRGARQHPGKKRFVIIDMGRNYLRHGLYGEDVDWREIFHNPKLAKAKKEESQAKSLECSLCGAIIKIHLPACPYCNTKILKEEREEKILEFGDTKEIREYRIQTMPIHLRGLKPGQMNWNQLEEYAHHMGYKKGWVRMQRAKPWSRKK